MELTDAQAEQAASQAEESIRDLEEIGLVWKVAQDWIDVANTAKSLFHRAAGVDGEFMKKSRYDYPDLEDSMNLAQLKGMPRPQNSDVSVITMPNEAILRQETEQIGSGMSTEGDWNAVMNEIMDEDEWRLWSFWDDPHLLSTAIDPSLGETQ